MAHILYAEHDIRIGDVVRHKADVNKTAVVTGIFFRGNPNGIDFCQYEIEHVTSGGISSQWASGTALVKIK